MTDGIGTIQRFVDDKKVSVTITQIIDAEGSNIIAEVFTPDGVSVGIVNAAGFTTVAGKKGEQKSIICDFSLIPSSDKYYLKFYTLAHGVLAKSGLVIFGPDAFSVGSPSISGSPLYYTKDQIDELGFSGTNFKEYNNSYLYEGGNKDQYVAYQGKIYQFISDENAIAVTPGSNPLVWKLLGSDPVLLEPLEFNLGSGNSIGGIKDGATYQIGELLEKVLQDLANPSIPAEYTAPTFNITLSGPSQAEVGVVENIVIKPTWSQNDAGDAEEFRVTKGGSTITTTPVTPDNNAPVPEGSYAHVHTYIDGTDSFVARIDHGQGPRKDYQNKPGVPDMETPIINAGTLTSSTRNKKGVWPYFYGFKTTNDIGSSDILSSEKVVAVPSTTLDVDWRPAGGSGNYLFLAIEESDWVDYTNYQDLIVNINSGLVSGIFNDFVETSVTLPVSGLTKTYRVLITKQKQTGVYLRLS